MGRKRFGVIGKPILHSKSPLIFDWFFKCQNIEASYVRFASRNIESAVNFCKELGLSGFNVTAPYKELIIKHIDCLDPVAGKIGSVNTVIVDGSKLKGYNTDYLGVLNSLPNVKDVKCLVIGAGGAARAACYGLDSAGANITITNRTRQKAESIAKQFNCYAESIEEIEMLVAQNQIIINTLPSGVKVVKDQWFRASHIVFDAIYNNSMYKEVAKRKCAQFVDGEQWLLNQAMPAFEIFYKKKIHLVEYALKNVDVKSESIALIGFMGAGKTTVGKMLAKKMNYEFIDTDYLVEKIAGKSITEIFRNEGELYFRRLETKVLKDLINKRKTKCIVSCGGGITNDDSNRRIMKDSFINVLLNVSPVNVKERISGDKRPLLSPNISVPEIVKLLMRREGEYWEVADLVLDTNSLGLNEITSLIYEEINTSMQN